MYGTMGVILRVIIKPRESFSKISAEPDRYLPAAVAILLFSHAIAILSLLDAYKYTGGWISFYGAVPGIYYVVSVVLQLVIWIFVIYALGQKYGARPYKKKIFVTIAYTIIPVTVGAIIASVIRVTPYLMQMDLRGTDFLRGASDTSPSYAFDFAGGYLVEQLMIAPFVIWSAILLVIAIKTLTGFGTAKSLGVFSLLIISLYLVSILLGIVSLLLQELWS